MAGELPRYTSRLGPSSTSPPVFGTATVRQTLEQRAAPLAFVAEQYRAERSIHELAELTDRTQSAVRWALDQAGGKRRGRGAARVPRR